MSVYLMECGFEQFGSGGPGEDHLVLALNFRQGTCPFPVTQERLEDNIKPLQGAVAYRLGVFESQVDPSTPLREAKAVTRRVIFADAVLIGEEKDALIGRHNAQDPLAANFGGVVSGLARVSENLFVPVRSWDVVRERTQGSVIFAQGRPVGMAAAIG